MRKSQIIIIVALLAMLVLVNLLTNGNDIGRHYLGGVPWYGWSGVGLALAFVGIGFAMRDSLRTRHFIEAPPPELIAKASGEALVSQADLERIDPDGPSYPHPVIFPERCIGCHACVDACPHDVLAIVNGIATPIARDQCMEDTACQVECPVSPKACIIVNTTKIIPPRKVPKRNQSFMTDVPGCYIIGDVSGTPLIKNAANEGADVINHITEELKAAQPEPKAETDVVIIGIGPAGLSAAVLAKKAGLRYIGVEQNKILATIEAYPANKYVFFKPETMDSHGGIAVEGLGLQREKILESWKNVMLSTGVEISEGESCKAVTKADDGDYFVVKTEKGLEKEKMTYKARRVIIAIGNSGTPMKLRLPGEETRVTRDGQTDDKVRYKLTDPEAFKRRKVIIVGAGNSAIEGAVDLVAKRNGDQITFRSEDEINEVTLVIRSDLKNDLKFGNKMQIYQCIDEKKIKVFFGTAIKEIRDEEVVLMNARTSEEKATLANDYIFAMIGGDRPTKFLEAIGIKIG
ncbi:MAG: NAD(P)-binding domain-containing protein [Pyrinomonadaceae bacterium]